MHTGSCLCGGVRYQITGELAPIQVCHCGQCRKAQGSAFATNLPVAADAFRLTAGADALKSYESSPGKRRWFCGECGSPVYSRLDSRPDVLRVRAGGLDAPVASRPAFHFYVASKADWWDIADDLPQHPDARPA